MPEDLIVQRPQGLYCPAGDFFIDPWRPVARAVITHAHADHARTGHGSYLAVQSALGVLRSRLGAVSIQGVRHGEVVHIHGVQVSLHPAGHVLGSAQVRVEHGGQVWVASGDYKLDADPTCTAFEPVRCHTFISESTFGLPIYRWPAVAQVMADINSWWAANAAAGRASVLACYSFGKAQRLLAGVDASIGPIVVHPAVEPLNRAYRAEGVALPDTSVWAAVNDRPRSRSAATPPPGALVLCPPSALDSAWARCFGEQQTAFASGWMRLRGARRRAGHDRGFVLSDHADWPGLHRAIGATGAQRVIVTHGSVATMVRHLRETGLQADRFETEYGDGHGDGDAAPLATADATATATDAAP